MNLQKPIVKPSGAQSLFELRKSGTVVTSGLSVVGATRSDVLVHKVEPVVKRVEFGHELGLMTNRMIICLCDVCIIVESVLMALHKKQAVRFEQWHAPWKLHRVIQGHQGWVRSIDVDPSNEWFATGSNDRMIKIWDLATGVLRLSLTGHTHHVRAVRVHPTFKYLFSAGEDNMVKCWDLEQNKVIRHYHGHLSGVYCMDVHPEESWLFTGARDASVRMWDIRTKECVHILGGHTHTVQCVSSQSKPFPELISGSTDATVRLWDIRAGGRAYKTLTHHKKGIRSISVNHEDDTFSTVGGDQVKVWSKDGEFDRNMTPHSSSTIVNCTALGDDGLFVTGADDGTLSLRDWNSGKEFQKIVSPPQPGSLEAENGIFDTKFDFSKTRLITAECDKTIKIYRMDETALDPNQ